VSILIKNGLVIDPANKLEKQVDLLIENGKISKIGTGIKKKAKKEIDARGKIVAPGFVDMHTHLREPGREDSETILTGMKAAVSGGFTTITAMPNTEPACDGQSQVRFLLERAKEIGLSNLLPIGTITKARKGKELSEMGELKNAGCLAVSDDGSSVEETSLMRRALEYSSMLDLLIISHCEDKALASDGVMREGYISTVLGLRPIPSEAESIIVERDVQLAENSGAKLHIAHISAAKSIEIVKEAKKRGVKITAEVTPHHIALTDEAVRTFDTNTKVNPPLATKKDVKALREALKNGTIDAIATDHAPHPGNEKEKEFDHAPFGMIGLESALSVLVETLVDGKILTWTELIEKLTINPCRILKYDRGTLSEGAVADVVLIDPKKEWVYSKDVIKSKSKNSPFIGKTMKSKVTNVIIAGKLIAEGL